MVEYLISKMANILFFTDHKKGHIIPTFGLSQSLQDHGYDISYFGIADAMKEVAKAGFKTDVVLEDHFPAGSMEPEIATDTNPVPLILEGKLDDLINNINPGVILTTVHNPLEALAFYYKYRIKIILFWAYFPEGDYSRPDHSPYAESIKNLAQKIIYTIPDPETLSGFIRYAKKSLGKEIDNLHELTQPFAFFTHFVAASKELLTQEVYPRLNEVYLGPCISETEIFEYPKGIDEEMLQCDDSAGFIYCSMGSWADEINTNKALEAFQNIIDSMRSACLKEHKLLLSAGELAGALNTYDIPDNVSVYKWLPQPRILKHASLAIIHGGMGSIKECIANNAPMLITPLGLDQFENEKRVIYHELGKRLTIEGKTTEQIAQSIANMLHNREIRNKLKAMKAIFDQDAAENRGVAHIKKMLETRAEKLFKLKHMGRGTTFSNVNQNK